MQTKIAKIPTLIARLTILEMIKYHKKKERLYMKFCEKLIILRKKAMLSQEQLAERLNVTRQTISKWELDQSKPDMDKLKEISKLFAVDLETLTNDEIFLEKPNNVTNTKKNTGNRKIILIIAIIIFIGSLVTLTYRIGTTIKTKIADTKEEIKKQQEKEKAEQEKEKERQQQEKERQEKEKQEREEKQNKESFNFEFETLQGTKSSNVTGWEIDSVVENNKKNAAHLIEVIFDGTSYGTDAENIRKIKNSLKGWDGFELQFYEISLDYDNNGYVNKVTIETK